MNAGWMRVRVAQKRIEAADICTFGLADPMGEPLPNFVRNSTRTLFINILAPKFMQVTGQRNYTGSQRRSRNCSNKLRNGYPLVNTCIAGF